MEFKFQLRRKDKRCLIPVSRDVHSALCFYATKTDTTITDAVNRIFFWFFEQEFKIQITPEHPLEKNKPPVFKKSRQPTVDEKLLKSYVKILLTLLAKKKS